MIRYTLTRLALLLLGLLVASVLIFLTLRVLPGDIAQLIAGTNSTPEQIEAIRERLGLNQPLLLQYLEWIGGIFRGDLGASLLTGSSVTSELAQKAQVTVPLGIMSLTIAILFSIPLGVLSAMRRGRGDGTALSVGAQALAAVPSPRPRRIAERTPRGMLNRIAIVRDMIPSGTVTCAFCASSEVTLDPVSSDEPSSPRKMPPIHSRY